MKSVMKLVGIGSFIFTLMIMGFGCNGNGDGWVEMLAITGTDTFTMTEYFPLTSSWETDKWTFFIDQREYDIKGVVTKFMVDTQGPYGIYWTNDENGVRMHGVMKDDGTSWLPSTPVIFADAVVKVGDKKEGTLIVEVDGVAEEFVYVIELLDVEDVSVPAGNFSSCLKFGVLIYPAGEDPNEYGSETIWLAKGVGFVKGETDENAEVWILTRRREIRKLLSYCITPSSLPPVEQGIKDLLKKFPEHFEAENLDGVMSLFSEDYLDSCVDKAAARRFFEDLFSNNSDLLWFSSPGESEAIGDVAYATREKLRSGVDELDQRWWEWDRRGVYWREKGGEWKAYGNQVNFRPGFDIFTRNDAIDGNYLAISAVIRDCDGEKIDIDNEIDSLTIIGSPSTAIISNLKRDWNSADLEYFRMEDLADAKDGFYTFTLFMVDEGLIQFTDYLQVMPPLNIPNLVFPIGGIPLSTDGVQWWPPIVDVTFDWNDVDGADNYVIDLQYDDAGTWLLFAREYASQSGLTLTLPRGRNWRWRVSARQNDRYGELDNESRSDWGYFSTPQ